MSDAFSRRDFVATVGTAVTIPALAAACGKLEPTLASAGVARAADDSARAAEASSYVPVVTPGIPTLPYVMDGNVKVFQLTAEPVTIQFQDMSDPHGMRRRPINGLGV